MRVSFSALHDDHDQDHEDGDYGESYGDEIIYAGTVSIHLLSKT